jgi:YfiH family protein
VKPGEHLRHPLLAERGVWHGFGTRGATAPDGCLRPQQVHGDVTVLAPPVPWDVAPEADAIVSVRPGPPVAIVTADCVPILVAAGDVVAAVHAGWRGLARGVIERALDVVAGHAGDAETVGVVGPHIGPCCYEVDAPVLAELDTRYRDELHGALAPSRPGRHRLDLGRLARAALRRAGLPDTHVAQLSDACTFCDAEHFHSYRRDGARAGRLLHFVSPGGLRESS